MKERTPIFHTKTLRLQIKQTFELKRDILQKILWNQKIKKFFIVIGTKRPRLKTLDPVTEELTLKFQFDARIIQLKFTEDHNTLIIIDEKYYFWVFQVENFNLLNKLRIGNSFRCFAFADNTFENIFLNSRYSGLHLMNLKTKDLQSLNFKQFEGFWNDNIFTNSKCTHLFGNFDSYESFPAVLNVAKGFKFKVFYFSFATYCLASFTMSRDEKFVFSGYWYGKFMVTDLRSSKCINAKQFKTKGSLKPLKNKNGFITGGIMRG